MRAAMLGLLAETPAHPGAGGDAGFVDLPVAREAATDYPVIVGSSLKGALRDRARSERGHNGALDAQDKGIFGEQDNAGSLIVADARLLLLPVRSMTGHYKWVTCPHVIERLRRDRRRAGLGDPGALLPEQELDDSQWLGAGRPEESLFLEERQFQRAGDLPTGLAETLGALVAHETTRARLAARVVVVADAAFAWFARFGLAINARNTLDEQSKTSKNLWYEETLPPDTLLYAVLAERIAPQADEPGPLERTLALFDEAPYMQVGANMTVGQGFFAVEPVQAAGAAS